MGTRYLVSLTMSLYAVLMACVHTGLSGVASSRNPATGEIGYVVDPLSSLSNTSNYSAWVVCRIMLFVIG